MEGDKPEIPGPKRLSGITATSKLDAGIKMRPNGSVMCCQHKKQPVANEREARRPRCMYGIEIGCHIDIDASSHAASLFREKHTYINRHCIAARAEESCRKSPLPAGDICNAPPSTSTCSLASTFRYNPCSCTYIQRTAATSHVWLFALGGAH
jgi:hypothetical protein